MSEVNLKDQLESLSRVTGMMNDPGLTGDTLLLALALNHVYFEWKAIGRRAKLKGSAWKHALTLLGWTDNGGYQARAAVAADVPRFEPPSGRRNSPACSAPMVRREGVCGKPSSYRTVQVYDPETGAWDWEGGCSRHWPEIDAKGRATRKAWQANGSPKPDNNTGGALLRWYLEESVLGMYKWARPSYQTDTDIPEPKAPRPVFSVIRGGRA